MMQDQSLRKQAFHGSLSCCVCAYEREGEREREREREWGFRRTTHVSAAGNGAWLDPALRGSEGRVLKAHRSVLKAVEP